MIEADVILLIIFYVPIMYMSCLATHTVCVYVHTVQGQNTVHW